MSTDATAALLELASALSANTAAVRENTAAMREAPAQARPTAPSKGGNGGGVSTFPKYGRNADGPIAGASMADLEFYGSRARRGAVEKTGWKRDNDVALVAAIDAEIARQQGGGPALSNGAVDDFGPPPTDEDIPF